MPKVEFDKIFQIDTGIWIGADKHGYCLKYKNSYFYFPSLESTLYDLYENLLSDKLREKESKDIQELFTKVEESQNNLKKVIKDFSQEYEENKK
jgi:hypothetical protein